MCTENECTGRPVGRGLCSKHYQRWKRDHGPACQVDECTTGAVAHGYCSKHLARWNKYGDPNRVERGRDGSRKYPLNEAFFSEIVTERQAYWLGFVTADGGIIRGDKTNALRVELTGRDIAHVELMVADLGSNKPVSTGRGCARISFDSRRLVDDLERLGVTQRKSATVEPWEGPADLMPHYWRGMVDGDGTIYRTTRDGVWNVALCGSEPCVRAFAAWGSQICGSAAKPRVVKGSCWSWTVCGSYAPQQIVGALYGDASVALARKRSLADELRSIDFDARRVESEPRRIAAIRDSWTSGRHSRSRRS